MYHQFLELFKAGAAIDRAKKQLQESDREPDILQRFIKRGEALKALGEAEAEFFDKCKTTKRYPN